MGRIFTGGWDVDPTTYNEIGNLKNGQPYSDWDFSTGYPAIDAATNIPLDASIKWLVVSVLDQGAIGSCVSNAGFQAIRMKQYQQTTENSIKRSVPIPPLASRLMGYHLARSYHGMDEWDSGTHLRTFFRAINHYGFLPENEYKYKYDTTKFAKSPPPLAFKKAFDQRDPNNPLKYWRIFDTGTERKDAVKRALSLGHPVCFGTLVSNSFVHGEWFGRNAPKPYLGSSIIAGGHAMCMVGYDEAGVEVVNSWGEGWGTNGFCYLDWDYVLWEETQDLWVVESAPMYSHL